MKRSLSILILTTLIIACSQPQQITSLKGLDIPEINEYLVTTTKTLKATDIIELYHDQEARDAVEGTETISINTSGSPLTGTTATLIHSDLVEGPIRSNRIIMVLKQTEEKWQVLSIDRTWKCWRDQEGSPWKNTPCL